MTDEGWGLVKDPAACSARRSCAVSSVLGGAASEDSGAEGRIAAVAIEMIWRPVPAYTNHPARGKLAAAGLWTVPGLPTARMTAARVLRRRI